MSPSSGGRGERAEEMINAGKWMIRCSGCPGWVMVPPEVPYANLQLCSGRWC